jgi:hypothetical protein
MNSSPYSSPYLGPWLQVVTLGTQKKKYHSTICFYKVFIELIKRQWTSKNNKIADSFTAKFDVHKTPDFERSQGFCGFWCLDYSIMAVTGCRLFKLPL